MRLDIINLTNAWEERMKQITQENISQRYVDQYKSVVEDVVDFAYNYFYDDYSKYIPESIKKYNEIVNTLPEIKAQLEKTNQYIDSVGVKYSKMTPAQFLFMDNYSTQQKYTYQLNALKYPYDIYNVYNYSDISSKINSYSEALSGIIFGKNKNFFLTVHKFNIPSACINEILELDDKYTASQWREVAKGDKIFVYTKGLMSAIASTINKYGGEFGIVEEELYYTFAISNLLVVDSSYNVLGESKQIAIASRLSTAFEESDLVNKSENGKRYSDLLLCRDIAKFKMAIEEKMLTHIVKIGETLNSEIENYNTNKAKKRAKKMLIAVVVLFALSISFMFITFNITGYPDFNINRYLAVILMGWAITMLLLLPFILISLIRNRVDNNYQKKLLNYNKLCAQTIYKKLYEEVYKDGAQLISSKLYVNCSEKENELTGRCSKLRDTLDKYIEYRDALDKKIKVTTKYLPEIFDRNVRLLNYTYKQMQSGTAQDYQSALFQAQEIIKRENDEINRRFREMERQRKEDKHRREVMESQKRAEKYAQEQAEYAKRQADAAERQAEYERERRDSERETAKHTARIAEESSRQSAMQKEQMRRWEEERLRQENERNSSKWG